MGLDILFSQSYAVCGRSLFLSQWGTVWENGREGLLFNIQIYGAIMEINRGIYLYFVYMSVACVASLVLGSLVPSTVLRLLIA